MPKKQLTYIPIIKYRKFIDEMFCAMWTVIIFLFILTFTYDFLRIILQVETLKTNDFLEDMYNILIGMKAGLLAFLTLFKIGVNNKTLIETISWKMKNRRLRNRRRDKKSWEKTCRSLNS